MIKCHYLVSKSIKSISLPTGSAVLMVNLDTYSVAYLYKFFMLEF